MTSLDSSAFDRDKTIAVALARGAARVSPGATLATREQSFGEDILQFLGRGEEATVNIIGQLLTDDPKYNSIVSSGPFEAQNTFAELFRDSGIENPIAAAVLGIGAAILNPVDPLNKLKIFAPTKLGRAGERAAQAGIRNLKTIKIGDKLVSIIDAEKVANRVEELTKALSKAKAEGATKQATRQIQRNLRVQKTALQQVDEVNTVLRDLQLNGATIEDIMLAPTAFEQARRGQRHLIGFSGIKSLEHVPFLKSSSPFADVSRIGTGTISRKADAAIIKATSAAKDAVGKPIKAFAAKVADIAGVPITKTPVAREFATLVKQLVTKTRSAAVNLDRELESILRRIADDGSLNQNDIIQVIQTLEVGPEVKSAAINALNKLVLNEPDIFTRAAGKTVSFVEEGRQAKLSKEQQLLLTPSGIDDATATTAVNKFKASAAKPSVIGEFGEHEAKIIDDLIVIRTNSTRAIEGALDELNGIYQQKVWKKVKDSSGNTFLVQKRLPFANKISFSNQVGQAHLENLEIIADQLRRKGLGFARLTPDDVLVAQNGAVQIINPDVIVKFKSSRAAASNSRFVLDAFADAVEIPQGSAREFARLKRPAGKATKGNPVEQMRFRVMGSADEILPEAERRDVLFVAGNSLLDEAVNTSGHKFFIEASYDKLDPLQAAQEIGDIQDFARANGIEAERELIRKAVREGRLPTIKPIEAVVDPTGQLWIVEGRDRLTAALLEGFEVVPVKKVAFTGDAITDVEKGFFAGRTFKLEDAFRAHGPVTVDKLEKLDDLPFSSNYRIIKPSGDIASVSNADLGSIDFVAVQDAAESLISLGPSYKGKAREARIKGFFQSLALNTGSPMKALVTLAETVENSPTIEALAENLSRLTATKRFPKGINTDNLFRNPVSTTKAFNRLKKESSALLDALASKGFLTERMLQLDNLPRLNAAGNSLGGIVQIFDPNTNRVTFLTDKLNGPSLKRQASNILNSHFNAADIEPLARVNLVSMDGLESLKVSDFVTEKHPRLAATASPKPTFIISEADKSRLAKEGIFVVNAENAEEIAGELKERGLQFGVLFGRTVEKGNIKFQRPVFTYFITKSGELVISTKNRDVRNLFSEVFKEGPIFAQEFGVIDTGVITVSNPLGGIVNKIGAGEIGAIEKRLKEVATRFKQLGFSESTRLDVLAPFDQSIWQAMYGEKVTIGDILSPDWEITIPKNIEGMVPDIDLTVPDRFIDVDIEQVKGAVQVRRPRLANKRLQTLLDTIRDVQDEAFVQEAMAGLPVQYHASYFGRTLTKEAKEALNKTLLEKIQRESKVFKNVESFFKQRVFTDLTTLEINEIVKRLQKGGIENPDKVIDDVVLEFRNRVLAKKDPNDAKILASIADALPEGISFFEVNPFAALQARFIKSQRAINRKQLVDFLERSGAVLAGTPKEIEELKLTRNGRIVELERQLRQVNDDLSRKTAEYTARVQGSTEITTRAETELLEQIDELKQRKGVLEAQRSKAVGDFVASKNIQSMSVDFNAKEVHISGEDALKLIEKGVIRGEDIIGDASDVLVRIPFEKYRAALDEGNIRVMLFPPEVAAEVDRYFSVARKEGFDRFLSLWDDVHSAWRAWTLFPIPSYHIRNLVSNTFMAWLAGVDRAESYGSSFKILKLLRQHRKGKLTLDEVNAALESIEFANAASEITNARELLWEFESRGGLTGGLHFNEFNRFGDVRRATTIQQLYKKHGLMPSSTITGSVLLDNAAIRGGISVASAIENYFRLATFIDAWTKGRVEQLAGQVVSGFEAAAIHMKRAFYDYSDLSAFERQVLRRTIPFYAWSRHNIPRMLTTMVTDPVKHFRFTEMIRQMEIGATGGIVEEEDLPQWMQGRFGFVISKQKDGAYLVKLGEGFFPMNDVYKLFAGEGIRQMINDGITPFVKVPIEQLVNKSFFTDRPIENVPGERARGFTLGAAGFTRRATTEGPLGILNLVANESLLRSFFRFGNEATKLIDPLIDSRVYKTEHPTFLTALLAFAIGNSYLVDPIRARRDWFKDWDSRHKKLKNMRKYYREIGYTKQVEDLDRMINWMRLQKPQIGK